MCIYYLQDNYSLYYGHMHTHAHNVLPKMKPYAIALSWLGVQAPTAKMHVVLEVPSGMDEQRRRKMFLIRGAGLLDVLRKEARTG